MSKEEITSCPFCGGESFVEENHMGRGLFNIRCSLCRVHGKSSYTREGAIMSWNERYKGKK